MSGLAERDRSRMRLISNGEEERAGHTRARLFSSHHPYHHRSLPYRPPPRLLSPSIRCTPGVDVKHSTLASQLVAMSSLSRSVFRTATGASATRSTLLAATRTGSILPMPLRVTSPIASSSASSSSILTPSLLRSFSSTPASWVSRPQTGPHVLSDTHMAPNHRDVMGASTMDAQMALKKETGGRVYPDYSKGPSALDKASQLFFFTEILRGE